MKIFSNGTTIDSEKSEIVRNVVNLSKRTKQISSIAGLGVSNLRYKDLEHGSRRVTVSIAKTGDRQYTITNSNNDSYTVEYTQEEMAELLAGDDDDYDE